MSQVRSLMCVPAELHLRYILGVPEGLTGDGAGFGAHHPSDGGLRAAGGGRRARGHSVCTLGTIGQTFVIFLP